jgi:nucleoside-diphosphate-sugar epimerase
MRVFATGGTGVLGGVTLPKLRALGHEVVAPTMSELDLFDPLAVGRALEGAATVYHLATHIPPHDTAQDPGAWQVNDRLRTDASRILVDGALATDVEIYVFPSVTFASTDRPITRSALDGEREAQRFAATGRPGVVVRFGLLDGPGTGYERPDPKYGATLHIDDAGEALALALEVPSGVYDVCRDGESVSNEEFKRVSGWRPLR